MSAPTGFAAMSHESHGLCFCSADGHCGGGSECDGQCGEYTGWLCPDCGKESEDGEPESHLCWGVPTPPDSGSTS